MPHRLRKVIGFSMTLMVGAIGATGAEYAGWPLPWMVGAMTAVIFVRCCGWLLVEIPYARRTGQWLIASAIGMHFTTAVANQVLENFPVMIGGALLTLATGLIGIALLHRNGVDLPTSFFSLMPVNATEMIVLGEKYRANPARVAAAHSLRLVLIVLLVPAVVTWGTGMISRPPAASVDWSWLAIMLPLGGLVALAWSRVGAPNGFAFGPMVTCAVFTMAFDLHIGMPPWLSKFGQLLLATSLGSYFDRAFFRSAPQFLSKVVIFTVAAILLSFASGLLLSRWSDVAPLSLALGLMPGSSSEMSLTAEALSLGVALVTAMQIIRMIVVMAVAEPLFKLWSRRTKPNTPG
ncbi:AbrB family transcriptional regulator [Pseudomonas taiwanensis]|uniref:AbrB family transcriptional regulator n=1 Tax=Pseudomonas taiwanensis TaxID=470150 RepID=A0ABR6V807_9PSED|nr:AbrB family transcriptional regulator [Pseudomonas taiwanensis]MBC3476668.1 AbrB family transcriptional regulator [Pseudomonas taiwanensis]